MENGGNFNFVIEDVSYPAFGIDKGPYAMPNDTHFWFDLFDGTKNWGLKTYEQDWTTLSSNLIMFYLIYS